jgi:trk system potassium uptake protein TrkH
MVKRLMQLLGGIHPIRLTFLGYLSYVVMGWIALCLPFSVEAGAERISALDHLFIATSAVSTTGLATVSPGGTYSIWGELFILFMIQIGGIGYMTLGSFVMLTRTSTISRLREDVSRTTFSLPKEIPLEMFLRQVVFFTVGVEVVGALALWAAFTQAGVPDALWQAIFHSISAFCTAGFSLFDSGMEPFRDNFWVNFIIGALSYAGAIGFLVWTDFVLVLMGKRPSMTLTSKIILSTTIWLTVAGTIAFMTLEPSIAALPAHQRLMVSLFQTMTAITTVGFNTHPISELSYAMIVFVSFLMLIGASPSGTGGGLKSTTFTIFVGLVKSSLRNCEHITFRGKRIPSQRVRAATSSVITYIAVSFFALFLLAALDDHLKIEDLFFEVISAAGTVGISRGVTGDLSPLGKLVITAVMFAGRLGPLVLGIALFMTDAVDAEPSEEEDLMT